MAQFAAFKLAAFHTPCTFYRKRIGLLCWRFFTRGVILSFGRAVSETAAVIFTAGTALNVPTSIFSPVRTMAVHFYILAVEGISLEKAYATGTVLIVTVLLINVIASSLLTRLVQRRVRR